LNPLKHNGKEKEVQFQKINPTLSKLKRKAGMHNYDRPMWEINKNDVCYNKMKERNSVRVICVEH